MRWMPPALVILTVSCGGPADPREEYKRIAKVQAREAFESWRDALARGDEVAGLKQMSDAMKSEWLYTLLDHRDRDALKWKRGLDSKLRSEVDLWYLWCKKHRAKILRAEPLTRKVLDHPSFLYLWKEVFLPDRDAVIQQMLNLVVIQVTVDAIAVIVQVRNVRGEPELYQMIRDPRGGWKVDGHLRAGGRWGS